MLDLESQRLTAVNIKGVRRLTEHERVSKLLHFIKDWCICGVFTNTETTYHGLNSPLPCLQDESDIKKKYPGAEGDATDFFNEIVTLNLDKVSTPLKNLSKRLINPSDLNSLTRSFNAKAKNLIDNNFERSAIIDEMKDLNLDTSQDYYILYNIMNDKNS